MRTLLLCCAMAATVGNQHRFLLSCLPVVSLDLASTDGYHLDCAEPQLRHVPRGQWYCHKCKGGPSTTKAQRGRPVSARSQSSNGSDSEGESEEDKPAKSKVSDSIG